MLKNEKGEASYISVFIYILVAVILIAFIIKVFRIISAKQQMDHAADQLVKQIQLGGSVNGETDALFAFLSGEISGADQLDYHVECSDSTEQNPNWQPVLCYRYRTLQSGRLLEFPLNQYHDPGYRGRCQ